MFVKSATTSIKTIDLLKNIFLYLAHVDMGISSHL